MYVPAVKTITITNTPNITPDKTNNGNSANSDRSPQTGDNNLILLISLLFVSGSFLSGTVVFGKKKYTSDF